MSKHIAILVILICLTILVGVEGDYLHISVRFKQVHGLVEGDRVLFKRDAVGFVECLTYTASGQFHVKLSIEKKSSHEITTFSRFIITDDIEIEGQKAITIISTGRLIGQFFVHE